MGRVVAEELTNLQLRVLLLRLVVAILPSGALCRVRARAMGLVGFDVATTATMFDIPRMHGAGRLADRLRIGAHTMVNVGCRFDLSGPISIGEGASLGQDVLILTSTHEIGGPQHRAADLVVGAVTIGAGAWIGARAILAPGVTVGSGAIVAAGAVVLRDVEPDTMVAGVPAVLKRRLPSGETAGHRAPS